MVPPQLEQSPALQDLQLAILRQELPPVSAPETSHNLPAPVTSFIGREAHLADLERLLEEARLVTLTGVGGVGKTRLALEAAARAVFDMPSGACFVDLASVADGALVARAGHRVLRRQLAARVLAPHETPNPGPGDREA